MIGALTFYRHDSRTQFQFGNRASTSENRSSFWRSGASFILRKGFSLENTAEKAGCDPKVINAAEQVEVVHDPTIKLKVPVTLEIVSSALKPSSFNNPGIEIL